MALFTIGALLWRAGVHAHARTAVSHYLPVALIKLLLHQLLAFGSFSALAWWFGVRPT